MALIRISDTVMLESKKISGIEIIHGFDSSRLMVYCDGKAFESGISLDELIRELREKEEVKQYWAGK